MSNQKTPEEYAWISPGVWGEHYMLDKPVEFTSTPFLSSDFAIYLVWAANTKNGKVKVDGFVQVAPPKDTAEETLAKARTVISEHRNIIEAIQRFFQETPELTSVSNRVLVALVNALNGGKQ